VKPIKDYPEYRAAVHAEHERHKRRLNTLDQQLALLQNKCLHENKKYQADPAGDGSESYWECGDCGVKIN